MSRRRASVPTCLLFGAVPGSVWSASLPVQPPACVVEECRGRAEVVLVGVTLTRTSRIDIDAICEGSYIDPSPLAAPRGGQAGEQSNLHLLLSMYCSHGSQSSQKRLTREYSCRQIRRATRSDFGLPLPARDDPKLRRTQRRRCAVGGLHRCRLLPITERDCRPVGSSIGSIRSKARHPRRSAEHHGMLRDMGHVKQLSYGDQCPCHHGRWQW